MDNANQEPATPDLEYFMGVLYKGYCGACGRLMFIAGNGMTAEQIKERYPACRWCERPVKWE